MKPQNFLEVLDHKAEIMRMVQGPLWEMWWEVFLGQIGFTYSGPQGIEHFRTAMRMSETFAVSGEMADLVSAVASSLPEETEVYREDFPSLQGFLMIPHPITVRDLRGGHVDTTAVLWNIYGGKVHLYHLSPLALKERSLMEGFAKVVGSVPHLAPWHYREIVLGEPLPHMVGLDRDLPEELGAKIELSGDTLDPEADLIVPDELRDEDGNPTVKLVRQIDPVVRWMVAALKLMAQPITDSSEVGIPRSIFRRLQRLNLSTKSTVIALRRKEHAYDSDTEGGKFFYSHRFLRRGHWRRQPYKETRGGEWRYRTIYIHPTIVGDPDLPLVVRDHVNVLLR